LGTLNLQVPDFRAVDTIFDDWMSAHQCCLREEVDPVHKGKSRSLTDLIVTPLAANIDAGPHSVFFRESEESYQALENAWKGMQ
jgi:hypothetical protein